MSGNLSLMPMNVGCARSLSYSAKSVLSWSRASFLAVTMRQRIAVGSNMRTALVTTAVALAC